VDDTTITINELPIGKWTDDYKSFLESLLYDKAVETKASKQYLVDFSNNSTEKVVNYTLKLKKDDLISLKNNNDIENVFKLVDCKNTNYSNMHLYNNKGVICKYDGVEEIMNEFYLMRLVYYSKRKEYMLKAMKKELDVYTAKIRFIEEFISGEINILQKEDEEIEAMLIEKNYPKFSGNSNESEIESENNDSFSYDYLLNMKIKSLTKKKIEELKKLYENKYALYNDLESKSDKDLWKDDLFKFLEVYRKKMEIYDDKMNDQIKTLNSKKVQNIKKTISKKGK
jgi:DNA topoisomerase-2